MKQVSGAMRWIAGVVLVLACALPAAAAKSDKIEELVANLKAAYRARIEKLDWMGDETKKEAGIAPRF